MKNLDVNQIGILGCGWLGTQLASRLHSLKWNIKVTKTTNEGVVALQKLGFESYRIALSENSLEGDLTFFENLDQITDLQVRAVQSQLFHLSRWPCSCHLITL